MLCRDLTAVLQNDPEALADKVTVTVDTFNAYSIDLRCRMYVTTTRLADFFAGQEPAEPANYGCGHKDGCDFAFRPRPLRWRRKSDNGFAPFPHR